MTALQLKLLRMFLGLRGQAAAIALLIGTGVAMYAMAHATLDSLRATREAVYREQHFADLFVDLKRAPLSLLPRIQALPGVAQIEARTRAPVTLRLPGFSDPITGLALSIPDGRQPQLNRLYLRSGTLPDPSRNDQLLVSEAFAEAHALQTGEHIELIINGRLRRFVISGIALSPEYIYQIRPGDLFPDFSRYALLWINQNVLQYAWGMQGAFNSLSLQLTAEADVDTLIARLDPLLEPWGSTGAYTRHDQLSHRYLEEELKQLATMATVLPLIFLGVAAFLLNMVCARLIQTQREQIAVLKAFGYHNHQVGWHYLQLTLLIVVPGSLLGLLAGAWLATALAELYQSYFRFPWLEFRLRPEVALSACLIAIAAALLGTLGALRSALRLQPAEAMRPPAPAHYRPGLIEWLRLDWLSGPTRILLRNLQRQPVKSSLSILAIALATALMMLTGFQQNAINHMLDVQFRLVQQQDMTLNLTDPLARSALSTLRAQPGVRHVEGLRAVPVILRHGHLDQRGSLLGIDPESQLLQLRNANLERVVLPPQGLLLTDHLATSLEVKPGDMLEVQVQEGRRPVLRIPLAAVVNEYVGVGAYIQRGALTRMLGEGDSLNQVLVAADPQRHLTLARTFEEMPGVLSVTLRERSIAAFNQLMDESLLVFTLFSLFLAGSIAFAVVYNNARIAFAERGRELASLRVMGFTQFEVASLLIGEQMLLTLLALLPGFSLGTALCWLLSQAMQTDLYRIPLVLQPATFAQAALVVLLATLLSSWMLLRRLSRLDMVSALKAAE